MLPRPVFAEVEFTQWVDSRRWRSRERNTQPGFSSIAGRGSFATRAIRQGEPVLVSQGGRGNFLVNHSALPNAARATNRAGLFALQDIQAGEEITEDYRFLPYFGQDIPELPATAEAAGAREYERLLRQHGIFLRPDP